MYCHLFLKIAITCAIFQLVGYLHCRRDLLRIIWTINVVHGFLIDIISAVRDSIFKRGGLGYVAREEGWYLINISNTATNKQKM
jgi:uncharacterized integral membrane protein